MVQDSSLLNKPVYALLYIYTTDLFPKRDKPIALEQEQKRSNQKRGDLDQNILTVSASDVCLGDQPIFFIRKKICAVFCCTSTLIYNTN